MERKRVFGTGGELLVHQLVAQGVSYAFPVGDPEIDFVMLARAQGVQGAVVREPQELEAALRCGVAAITAGEPYVLDVRVATVGTGADSTWHQRFKLRG